MKKQRENYTSYRKESAKVMILRHLIYDEAREWERERRVEWGNFNKGAIEKKTNKNANVKWDKWKERVKGRTKWKWGTERNEKEG